MDDIPHVIFTVLDKSNSTTIYHTVEWESDTTWFEILTSDNRTTTASLLRNAMNCTVRDVLSHLMFTPENITGGYWDPPWTQEEMLDMRVMDIYHKGLVFSLEVGCQKN
jgi:hypothetical protein